MHHRNTPCVELLSAGVVVLTTGVLLVAASVVVVAAALLLVAASVEVVMASVVVVASGVVLVAALLLAAKDVVVATTRHASSRVLPLTSTPQTHLFHTSYFHHALTLHLHSLKLLAI